MICNICGKTANSDGSREMKWCPTCKRIVCDICWNHITFDSYFMCYRCLKDQKSVDEIATTIDRSN